MNMLAKDSRCQRISLKLSYPPGRMHSITYHKSVILIIETILRQFPMDYRKTGYENVDWLKLPQDPARLNNFVNKVVRIRYATSLTTE